MRARVALAASLPLLLLSGCGGHAADAVDEGKGRATLTVKWPARAAARFVPNAANAIAVALSLDGKLIVTKTIPRPAEGSATSSTTFTGLAYGTYTVGAKAFPNADGSGVAQSFGEAPMEVTEDAPATLSLSMDSTVASLTLDFPSSLELGKTVQATATAKDTSGAIVLLAANGGAESLVWASDHPSVVSVLGTGTTATLLGLASGSARITATLDQNGVTGVASASVATTTSVLLAPSDGRTIRYPLSNPSSQGLLPGNNLLDGTYKDPRSDIYSGEEWRTLFPLSSLPPNATILSATFGVTRAWNDYNGLAHYLEAYGSARGTVALNIDGPNFAVGGVTDTVGSKTFDVTGIVRSLLASGSAFAGFGMYPLHPPHPTPTEGVAHWTSPKLTIVYSTP